MMTETITTETDKPAPVRDTRGRWLKGYSGNVKGRGGRPTEALNALADKGLEAVLTYDLATLRRALVKQLREGEERPGKGELQASLDRLARTCGRRITARTEGELVAELKMADPREVIQEQARALLQEMEAEDRRKSNALDEGLEALGLTGDDNGHDTAETV